MVSKDDREWRAFLRASSRLMREMREIERRARSEEGRRERKLELERREKERLERLELAGRIEADPLTTQERIELKSFPKGVELLERHDKGEDVVGEAKELLELRRELGV